MLFLHCLLLCLVLLVNFRNVTPQVDICQANCASSDRLYGPRRTNPLPHPIPIAPFPSVNTQFCQMGCQFFFSEFPVNTTCKRLCDYIYRYQITVGYSDLAEQAINECRDGCDIAVAVCQPGFYCIWGKMLPCEPGRYRTTIPDLSIEALNGATICDECPPGRYRSEEKGKAIEDCSKCPIGKYAAVTGGILVSDCQRCEAGKFAEEEGMSACKCMTADSCDMSWNGEDYYVNYEDFSRETIPFIGRW